MRLNQAGLELGSPKTAVVAHPSRKPLRWRLIDAAGKVQASGLTRVFGDDPASGEHVHQVEFGAFDRAGEGYRLLVGQAISRRFAIVPQPYGRLKYDALAYFYHNRSGVPIEARLVGDAKWARPAGHMPDRATCFDKADLDGNLWSGCSYELDATGGWYDAGDHGKYVVNGGIAVWTLQNAYERAVRRGTAAAFADGRLAIPESANGVNDLLDETRWEMEFLLRMQAPEGARLRLPVGPLSRDQPPAFTEVDASGMAHHKLHDERWSGLPLAPHDDTLRRYLYPPTTAATLNLAAAAAQCARVWREVDASFSDRCLAAAERAYAAARRNPSVYAWDRFDGGGGYGDTKLEDEFYWAAAELYATTGRPAYLSDLRASPVFGTAPPFSWGEVAALGTITLSTIAATPSVDAERARSSILAAADRALTQTKREGYRLPYSAPDYAWGSNSDVLNRALLLALAHDITGRRTYRDGVLDATDYLLGRNPLDRSYVTGYGARPMRNPHHRFWAHQLDSAYPSPPAGALSGGPNSLNMSDPVAQKMSGSCRPQTCWTDDAAAFSLNEVAINWNAPLVWVAAFLDER